jgi:NAD(P)-dependent dehydrogenase (short-subunit alcohol dehydrogenase family)
MMPALQGKVAMITGGLGALGLHVCRRFLQEGARIALPVRPGGAPAQIPDDLRAAGSKVFIDEADLEREDQVRAFVKKASAALGPVGILINTAGGYAGGEPVGVVSAETLDRMLAVNLKTAFHACSAVLPSMRERNAGRIISIAAKTALLPAAKRGPYAIAKRAVITLTETIAEEVRGTGITANVIAPAIIVTPANLASMPGADSSGWVTPDALASMMVFLCSDDAQSINGTTIRAFGGV